MTELFPRKRFLDESDPAQTDRPLIRHAYVPCSFELTHHNCHAIVSDGHECGMPEADHAIKNRAVNLANVIGRQADCSGDRTTAHSTLERFYEKTAAGFVPVQMVDRKTKEAAGINLVYRRPLSVTEQLAACRSAFQIEMVLRDAWLFAGRKADRKTKERWAAVAEAKDRELRGWL